MVALYNGVVFALYAAGVMPTFVIVTTPLVNGAGHHHQHRIRHCWLPLRWREQAKTTYAQMLKHCARRRLLSLMNGQ